MTFLSIFFQLKMFLSKYKFFSCKFYCSYTVRTGVLRNNKKFLQKNSNLGLFRGENGTFLKVDYCYGLLWMDKTRKQG